MACEKSDVCFYVFIPWVGGVSVVSPIVGRDVNFNIAFDAALVGADSEDGADEIRSCFEIPEARVFHDDGLACVRFKFFGAKLVIVPDALKMSFRVREQFIAGLVFVDSVKGGGVAIEVVDGARKTL